MPPKAFLFYGFARKKIKCYRATRNFLFIIQQKCGFAYLKFKFLRYLEELA